MPGDHDVDVVLDARLVSGFGDVHADHRPNAGLGELRVHLVGGGRAARHLGDDFPATVVLVPDEDAGRVVELREVAVFGLLHQGVDDVSDGTGPSLVEDVLDVFLDHVVGRGMDVEQRDAEHLGGLGGAVEVVSHHASEDVVHAGPHEVLGDVDRDPALVEDVGLHPHDLGEDVARPPQGVVRDDGVDPLPLLAEAVCDEDLRGGDVYTPQDTFGVRLLGDLLPPAETAVGVGVPEALRIEELLLVVGEGLVIPVRFVEYAFDLLVGTRVVLHPRLDGETVCVVDLHVQGHVWIAFIVARGGRTPQGTSAACPLACARHRMSGYLRNTGGLIPVGLHKYARPDVRPLV